MIDVQDKIVRVLGNGASAQLSEVDWLAVNGELRDHSKRLCSAKCLIPVGHRISP